MGHNNGPALSSVQQCVVNALAAGATLSAAAESYGVHRVTVYRWIKNYKPFAAALSNARADFVLASRDRLYHLSVRALDTLLAVLENPKSSPAVLLRTAMFILQRPQLPKVGWSMPEPVPDPDGKKLLDSAIIEQDYDSLPGLYNIERDEPPEPPAESPVPTPSHCAGVPGCNRMQHDPPDCGPNCDPDCSDDTPAPSINDSSLSMHPPVTGCNIISTIPATLRQARRVHPLQWRLHAAPSRSPLSLWRKIPPPSRTSSACSACHDARRSRRAHTCRDGSRVGQASTPAAGL